MVPSKGDSRWCDAVSPTGPVPRCDRSVPVTPGSHDGQRYPQWLILNPAKRAARGATRSLPAGGIVAEERVRVNMATANYFTTEGTKSTEGRLRKGVLTGGNPSRRRGESKGAKTQWPANRVGAADAGDDDSEPLESCRESSGWSVAITYPAGILLLRQNGGEHPPRRVAHGEW